MTIHEKKKHHLNIDHRNIHFWLRMLGTLVAINVCIILSVILFTGCGAKEEKDTGKSAGHAPESVSYSDLHPFGSMELHYAKEFTVDFLSSFNMEPKSPEEAYALITIADQDTFLLVPEGYPVPENVEEDVLVIEKPLNHVYLAASSVMDFFLKLDAMDQIAMTGTDSGDWSIPEVKELIDSGKMLYGGKYSAPDYEMILEQGANLAIESTMIYHTPEVKEELESLGIPVLTDHASLETHPLGRVEWIRLYGLLSGRYDEAKAYMDDCEMRFEELEERVSEEKVDTPKKVAFFYISSNSYVNIRKPGDYLSKMIEMAGGEYFYKDLPAEEENAMSTMNLQMETFYEEAVDADILIYNSTVEGEIETIDQLLEKEQLLADFQAVKNGACWCTGKNMYQETTGTISMIEDFYEVIHEGTEDNLQYLHKLK